MKLLVCFLTYVAIGCGNVSVPEYHQIKLTGESTPDDHNTKTAVLKMPG